MLQADAVTATVARDRRDAIDPELIPAFEMVAKRFWLLNQFVGETFSELKREDDRQLIVLAENVRLSPEQARELEFRTSHQPSRHVIVRLASARSGASRHPACGLPAVTAPRSSRRVAVDGRDPPGDHTRPTLQ